LLVFKAPVGLPISQVEIVGQDFEVGRDVGFGFCLPLEPEASASLVYLLQQLGVRGRELITQRDPFHHTSKKNISTNPICLSKRLSDCQAAIMIATGIEKINYLIHLSFFIQKIVRLKDL